MVKAIMGLKGSGKTKTLVDMANEAVKADRGCVVYIEKGNTLTYDVSSQARLVNVEEYAVSDFVSFYGFIAGLTAGNYDITDIYVDGLTKICGGDLSEIEAFLDKTAALVKDDITVTLTISCDKEKATDGIKKYLI